MKIDYDTTLQEVLADAPPAWIDADAIGDLAGLESIAYGGCASGAYMPAVTYHKAAETMAEHGDDVLQYIQDVAGELPKPNDSESWSGMACFYLSYAVELWVSDAINTLISFPPEGVEFDDAYRIFNRVN
jgi:hypothetical protein